MNRYFKKPACPEGCTVKQLNNNTAWVIYYPDGLQILVSYETPVMAKFPDGTAFKLWTGSTMTTWKHIKAFSGMCASDYNQLCLKNPEMFGL